MRIFLFILPVLLFLACNEEKKSVPVPSVSKELQGTWVREKSYLCAGATWTDANIDHEIIFTDDKYQRKVEVQSICGANREGKFSVNSQGLTLGFNTISCESDNLCPAEYTIDQGGTLHTYSFDCPGVLKTDGQAFGYLVKDNRLTLTAQTGSDTGCIYTYIKQTSN